MSSKILPELPETYFFKSSIDDLPRKDDCHYTKYFCEENIWLLVKKIEEKSQEKLKCCYTIFVSNDYSHIPLWRQSASTQEDGLVIWDYHVVMVYCDEDKSWVYDFDTQLPFPTEFREYCSETFKTDELLQPMYHRLFRVINAESYLKYFSSDRRHMKNDDGSWKKQPPNFPLIQSGEHNLDHYISMEKDKNSEKFGNVLNLNGFIQNFLVKKTDRSSIDYMYPPEPSCM